jgi:hypothetical protein
MSDSAIDLGIPAPDEVSGISVIEWASLAEGSGSGKGGSGNVKIDSPSDRELHEHLPPPVSATDMTQEAHLPGVHSPRPPAGQGDSAIDLGANVDLEGPASPAVSSGSDSSIDLATDAMGLEGSGPAADHRLSDSGIDLAADMVAAAPDEGSVVELPDDVIVDEEGIDLPDSVTPEESGIDVETGPTGRHGSRPLTPPSESGVDLLAEEVILEERGAGAASGGSSRDLIAEGLESGVDLLGAAKDKEKKPAGEHALEDFLAAVGSEDPSSAVDLGSSHTMDVFSPSEGPASAPSDVDAVDLTADDQGADIDLDMGHAPAARAGAEIDDTGAIDLGADEVVVEEEGDEVAAEGGVEVDEAEADEQPVKQRGRTGAWVGGTVLGAVVGTAACLGLWVSGVEPPGSLREMVGTASAPKTGGPGTSVQTGPRTAPPAGFDQTIDRIKNGDLDKVTEQDLAAANETDPTHVLARAEHRWWSYLRAEKGKNPQAALSADAAPVKQALADLDKLIQRKSADALFLRAQIREMTGNRKGAEEDYKTGAEKFKADAVQHARFEAALLALETAPKVARHLPPGMRPERLAMLLIHLQAPPGGAGGNQAAPDEAGYRFWQAIRGVRQGKYDEAVKALDEARARHDQRRYLFPRKPQNPLSDPREEIFLRTCDELKAYWTLLARLKDPKYLELAANQRIPEVDALLKRGAGGSRTEVVKELAEKLLGKDKTVASSDELVKLIGDDRKATKDQAAKLEEMVEKQTKEITSLTTKLKDTATMLASTADSLKESVAREKALAASSAAANAALADLAKAADVEFKDVKTSKEALVNAVRDSARVAKMKDPEGTVRRLESERAADRAKLKERWAPAQMLPFWLAILESDRTRTDLAESALRDVRRVQSDPSASAADKARAQVIEGLVQRNQDRFADAEATLKNAQESLAKTKGPWLNSASAALREVSAPAAVLAQRASELAARGKLAEARQAVGRSLEVVKGRKGPLYAQRAALALDEARAKGAVDASDPLVAAARKDAQTAATEGLAEGHFLLGQVAEELGQADDAVRSYREAVRAHATLDEQGSRYRVALARALLKGRAGEAVPPRPAPPAERTGKAPAAPAGKMRRVTSLELLNLLVALTLQAPGLPPAGPNVREAEKLADEILAAGNKVPFDVRAQALAVKGLYTRALATYMNGLREQGLLAPRYANALLDLIGNHPALRRPEALAVADPAVGERDYAAGLNFFASRRYRDAEREFLAAVQNDNSDARYFYFLGLSRLAQGKREAYEDFDEAARLERLGRPDRAAVSAALERIQGPMRRVLNQVRTRPVNERVK